MNPLLLSVPLSLSATLGLELLFALFWGLNGRDWCLLVLVNLLTNPPAVVLYWLLCRWGGLSPWAVVPLLEGCVVLVEGNWYQTLGQSLSHPWRFALLVNLFSYSAGAVMQTLF